MGAEEARDLHLMGRVAAGDRAAFSELYDRHAAVLLGFLVRMLRRRDSAEEILQEVFVKAWKRAHSYRPERAAPRAWLLTMARSSAIDRIRSSQARARREGEWTRAERGAPAEPLGTRRLEADEARGSVSQALDRLPQEQRRCIELAFFEGLTHRQVAERLEQPLGTVKSRILLGMKRLRLTLQPEDGQ
ncbi:MAG: sigma-70 family RNA polymerase sigma factor [Thermoanaerobaculia bacterium]